MKLTSVNRLFGNLLKPVALISLLAIALAMFSSPVLAANTFRNPLNTDHGSDPWMTYFNGEYYLTATTWSTDPNVGVTMKHAPTIVGLATATPVTVFKDTTPSRCCNIWAPEFHLLTGPDGNQHWYLYYVAGVAANTDSQRMYVAESTGTNPLGPYTYKGQLAAGGPTDAWAVDPTILQLNGQLYLFYSAYEGAHYSTSQNIYGVALSNPYTISGSPVLISRPSYSWETGTAAVNEGPEILQHNGTTFLVFSATWCGNPNYQLGRSTYNGGNVLSQSSWVKYSSPVFSAANGQYSTAHNGFFKSPDGTEDWIVYHGTTSSGGACDNTRTTRVQKFTWNSDGTPNFGAPLPLSTDIQVPSGESDVPPAPTSSPTSVPAGANIAIGATPSTSYVSSWENLNAINDGFTPANSQDHSHRAYGNWPQTGTQWIEYDFGQNYDINQAAVYWWDDNQGIDMPTSGNLKYWNGSSYVNVPGGSSIGVVAGQYNTATFATVNTNRIRLEMTSNGTYSTGVIEFQVFSAGGSSTPTYTPIPPTNTPTLTATPTNTAIPGSSPLHWYKFDNNANDSGSSVANGTVTGGTYVTGKNAQAVSLNGSSQYVSLPTGIVSNLNDFTIATWVNASTISAWTRIFDFGSSTSVNMFLTPTSGSTIRFAITTGGNGSEQRINGMAPLTTGWHHVAVTLSGTTGRLYVDGVQVGQNTAMTLKPSSLGSTTRNWIGRSQYSGDAYLNGQIDEFRIYSRALSASEILALFQNP